MSDKQVQQILDAALSALREMEKWRAIASMMSHFDTNCIVVDCKHCREARKAYMDASIEYDELQDEAYEAFNFYKQMKNN